MSTGARRVMESVLKQIDALDLYGSVAIPKHHSQDDISDIYACALAACYYRFCVMFHPWP